MMRTHAVYKTNNDNPQERKRYIRKMFDSIVSTYDLLNHLLSFGIDIRWRKELLRRMGPMQNLKAIDLCCGTGDVSRLLRQSGAEVVSLDFSLEMLKQGVKKRTLARNFILADACFVPIRSGTFDAATIAFGIRNIPDLDRLISEVHRILKPEGRMAILELVRPQNKAISFIYSLYLLTFLPIIGGTLSGRLSAYQYLSGTISTFIHPLSIKKMLERRGFCRVSLLRKTFGISAIILCKKGQIT